LLPPLSVAFRGDIKVWKLAAPGGRVGDCGESGNLHGPQYVKLSAANTSSYKTKKGHFFSESNPEVDNQAFYNTL
jgi:hypothetical protein